MPAKNNYEKLWKISIGITLFINLAIIIFLIFDAKGMFAYDGTQERYVYESGIIRYVTPKSSALPVINVISATVLCLTTFLAIASGVVLVIGKIKTKIHIIGKIFLNLFLLFVTMITSLLLMVCFDESFFDSDYYPEYYEFSNENRKIVVCEESWLLAGFGSVYQIDSDNTAWRIGTFTTDDGYRNGGNYQINWTDDGITLTYNDGTGIGEKHYSESFFTWADIK